MMSSFKSCELSKFKYVILLLTIAILVISQKNCQKNSSHYNLCSSSLIFLFFDLYYETGELYVGKSHLLNTCVHGSHGYHRYQSYSRKGKKTLNNEHGSNDFLKVQ